MSTTQLNINPLKEQIIERYDDFILGIPIAFTIIPLSIFLLSPDEETGIFLLGVLFLNIIVLSSKLRQKNNVQLTTHNTIGISIGYLVGYFIMNHINNSNPGSLIASIIIGLILLLTVQQITPSLFIGYFFGIIVGLCFSHLYYKKKIHKQKLNKN